MGDFELQIFANRLKELRTQEGITQKDFAEKIGVTAAALSAYENNIKNPSVAVAKKIAQTFNISLDWLCGLTDNIYPIDELRTYSDAIRLLLKLDKRFNIDIEYKNSGINSDSFTEWVDVHIYDEKLSQFVSEWESVRALHGNATIDDDLYLLWINREMEKYSYWLNSTTTQQHEKEWEHHTEDTQ